MKLKEQKFITIDNPRKLRMEDLRLLYKNLIEPDPAFNISVQGGGFNGNIAELTYDFINDKVGIDKKAHILIINDTSLQLYNILNSNGCTNITLAYGDYKSDYKKKKKNIIGEDAIDIISEDDTTYNLMCNYIGATFSGRFRIVKLKEIMNTDMKFDLIISNPPYDVASSGRGNNKGTIPREILSLCRNISDKVVWIMPTSFYTPICSTIKDFKRISKEESAKMFDNASCPPLTIAYFDKNFKDNGLLAIDWKIPNTPLLKKYITYQKNHASCFYSKGAIFRRSNLRGNTVESKAAFDIRTLDLYDEEFFNNSLIFGVYWIANGLHSEEGDAVDNYWNHKCNTLEEFKAWLSASKKSPDVSAIVFEQSNMKKNCEEWRLNSKLYEKLLKDLRTGCGGGLDVIMQIIPHVDWSRPWTDEEILKDFDYSDAEIEEILHFNDDIK